MIQCIKRVVDRCGLCSDEKIEELRNEMATAFDIRDKILLSEIRNMIEQAGLPSGSIDPTD
jgi:hypothetical protein